MFNGLPHGGMLPQRGPSPLSKTSLSPGQHMASQNIPGSVVSTRMPTTNNQAMMYPGKFNETMFE